ncbi:MAG: hypothetical protein KKC28_02185 [Verrucomicrobia bacterium]|nr:hypothetical protein [Verrucomicrobiota bacterium]
MKDKLQRMHGKCLLLVVLFLGIQGWVCEATNDFIDRDARLSAELSRPASAVREKSESCKLPFYAETIETTPGGILTLHPRLIPAKGLADSEYTFVFDFPEGIKPSDLTVAATDACDWGGRRIDSLAEIFKEGSSDGQRQKQGFISKLVAIFKKPARAGQGRNEFHYQPDMTLVCEGIELNFGYSVWDGASPLDPKWQNTGTTIEYMPVIKFFGSFDWRTFEHTVTPPSSARSFVPLLLKWPQNPTESGTLYFRRLEIRDNQTGEIVLDWRTETPVCVKAEKGKKTAFWLPPGKHNNIKLLPGRTYRVVCEAKGENIRSSLMPPAENALGKGLYYTRLLIFNVSEDISLPATIAWRIQDKKGNVFRKGDIALVRSGKTMRPKRIETSCWTAEKSLHFELPSVQEFYIRKLAGLGFNTVLPEVNEMKLSIPVDKVDFALPQALEAKRLGLQTRVYMRFLYHDQKEFADAHPEFAVVNSSGKKVGKVCITYGLDGGKYDNPPSTENGGRQNPWLGNLCQTIQAAVRANSYDGIWWDHEINAATVIKQRQTDTCACPRCLRAFQDFAKLDQVPSLDSINNGPLYDRWVDFRCWQYRRVWRLIHEAAKEVNSNVTFGIYSGWANEVDVNEKRGYGVQWDKSANLLDFASARAYAANALWAKRIDVFKAELAKGNDKAHPLPKVVIAYTMYGMSQRNGLLPDMKNSIVRLIAQYGVQGWSLYGIEVLDDQLARPMREAHNIIAKYEDFFLDGVRADDLVEVKNCNTNSALCDDKVVVKGLKEKVDAATWRLGTKEITVIFNRAPEIQDVVVSKKDARRTLNLKVGGYDCLVVEW